jgi:iron complex transport system ATP-binding protein
MDTEAKEILSFQSLLIGYRQGNKKKLLLPPLTSGTVRGELISLIGRNGIGKSTLLRTIAGLQLPLGGHVILKDKRLEEYNRYNLATTIGYISTEPVRVSNMKVYDLVSLGRYPYTNWTGKLTGHDHELVSEAITRTGMEYLRNRYINELSDGERQRAMIARVLAQDTEIMVLDEPTAFLDVRSRYEIIHLLHKLSRSKGKTIIFSTHDFQTAVSESDKIWLILEDSFIEGAPEDLILNGSFETLFDASSVKFNSKNASFSFRKELRGTAKVEGQGMGKYWTEKALNRAGFQVVSDNTGITISIKAENNSNIWVLRTEKDIITFDSVYQLIRVLNRIK